ncbi:MAG: proteinase inhibitor I4 serpin [Candidatus Marinimicrobia bacterium]|jgi:hypothetical protein|nr:proteinase inhibitor I4 serpin [Candidatus Neomarinimicrobiota bacterium]MBT3840014.1 proteinase inhibitor I4 serpin [Candidatus Neomarinimicrobiota bacterium]MBT4000046.1 proteinase inhibitor I4 serpin [Candidatus Neomarinimicrobiota bacterium]MBT4282155.1 proteinase inhibitor I4 serpin [Candidatus Neomarinimicrobiota bacterium]MBT4578894.1 proteinase inhibitor I4 serpin [Candidatus Neomarinimicrobiota bacterium]
MKNLLIFIFIISTFFCCKEDVQDLPDSCYLEPDPGPCEAYIPSYYFDQGEGKCKEFIYGGCGGVVPFITLEECQESCE